MTKFFKSYGFVLLVGAYFALTTLYTSIGSSQSVFWATYIKTVRELFLIGLVLLNFNRLSNVLSILMGFSAIAVSAYYMLFRLVCAYASGGNYKIYRALMADPIQSLMLIVFIFSIFVLANYLNRK